MRKHFINLETWTTHLVVVGHSIQGFNKICSPFKDHFLSRKKKIDMRFWMTAGILIFSHDSIPILLAILCQDPIVKAVAWGPQNGVKLPIYLCSHTHLIESKGEHHWYCKIKYITQSSGIGTIKHSYVYCWIQLLGHLLDYYNRCHSGHGMNP